MECRALVGRPQKFVSQVRICRACASAQQVWLAERFVSGHAVIARGKRRIANRSGHQRLKPSLVAILTARLKPRPFKTEARISAVGLVFQHSVKPRLFKQTQYRVFSLERRLQALRPHFTRYSEPRR